MSVCRYLERSNISYDRGAWCLRGVDKALSSVCLSIVCLIVWIFMMTTVIRRLNYNFISELDTNLFTGLSQLRSLWTTPTHWVGSAVQQKHSKLSSTLCRNILYNRIARIEANTFKDQTRLETLYVCVCVRVCVYEILTDPLLILTQQRTNQQ